MTDFTDAYADLLIKQYWEQANAHAEISAQAATWEKIRDIYEEFGPAFDVDPPVAVDPPIGAQLDIMGKRVGLLRSDNLAFADDTEYLFFIRVKIAKNNGTGFMATSDKQSINDVVLFAFDGLAYVVDNQNMTLTLYLEPGFDPVRLQLVLDLNLLPKPAGVRYALIIEADLDNTFGFSNNPTSKGFASKFDGDYDGGLFANKVFI